MSDAEGRADDSAGNDAISPYVESPIIMTTVRVITPFVFTFGLFVMFHGADSSGGGFQGGVIVGTVVLMLGLAFGIETTRRWVGPKLPAALVGFGVLVFLLIGFGSVLLGGDFLQYTTYGIKDASKYGIELVELAIGLIVAGVVTGLLFVIAAGSRGDEHEYENEHDRERGGDAA
ncbi:MnhB domain-containing protein [Salinigranum marinum]|uniref:MnhB domain-containing protein n=1 Tax=Salinigranum marinum TaxID=1515595 RepID=UPI002989D3A9|nr:MnhB domain-containing protein [Salinigranum marinum]